VPMQLLEEIDALAGQQAELCYHCHKCTAGCPVAGAMEFGPDLILQMAALNQAEAVLGSHDIWLCVGCFTCATRCPNGVDVAAAMDALRQIALARSYPAGEPDTLLFHRLFLRWVRRFGRSHEAFLLGLFKLRSHVPLMNDVPAGLGLLVRGKVPLLPEQLRASEQIERLFRAGKQ
jgi:heterodisulfide reductase subunit C